MKRLLFILFLLPATGSFAQSDSAATLPALKLQNRPLFLIDSAAPNHLQQLNTQTVQSWLAQARVSRKTSKGKIYQMPIDSMPCLVPDTQKTAPMPGIKPLPDSRMPNAFRMKKTAGR